MLPKSFLGHTIWHLAAGRGHVEVLEKLWKLANELQLKLEELRMSC